MSAQKNVLFVFTSAAKALDGKEIGWYLPEAAHPYYKLKDSVKLVAASPAGGAAPLDQNSVEAFKDDKECQEFQADEVAQNFVKTTKKLSDINASDFDAVFVVGGHGPMIDLATDQTLAKILAEVYDAGKPVAAVCHGPAALTSAKSSKTGKSILDGSTATGFSNAEEDQTPYTYKPTADGKQQSLPFSLEERLQECGATYVKAEQDWGVKVVWSGGILTGQNPASAGPLGDRLKDILA